MKIQVNINGAWRNVVEFPTDRAVEVRSAVIGMAAATTGWAAWSIVEDDGKRLWFGTRKKDAPKPRVTITSRIVEALRDGPGTTAEVAAALNQGHRRTSAHLCVLLRRGLIERQPFPSAKGGQRWLWSLKEA